ncbi:MAG: tetratricopeptide repeat protein [Planctomycetota bacterium]|jgi:uncharacterized protein YoxC
MTEDRIEKLLQKADRAVFHPSLSSDALSAAVRIRAGKKHFTNITATFAVAALILIVPIIWNLIPKTVDTIQDKSKIASLEEQVRQLEAKTNATLNLVREVLEHEQKQHRLDELQAELANIPDPLEETKNQINKTAFILVYQADRMYRELNQKDSAVEAYNRVIKSFPQTPSADTARQRLLEIKNSNVHKENLKI